MRQLSKVPFISTSSTGASTAAAGPSSPPRKVVLAKKRRSYWARFSGLSCVRSSVISTSNSVVSLKAPMTSFAASIAGPCRKPCVVVSINTRMGSTSPSTANNSARLSAEGVVSGSGFTRMLRNQTFELSSWFCTPMCPSRERSPKKSLIFSSLSQTW